MNYHRISIMGCGWLGFPLAKQLIHQEHFVRGSTTTKEKIPMLEEAGIEPYYIKLDPRISGDDVTSFFDVDIVVLAIPPPRVDDRVTHMLQQGEEVVSYLNASPVKRVLMVSSTGVYGFHGQDADETDSYPPETENGKGLVAMEKKIMEECKASVAVVRLAGLIGPGRHPGRFLSGQGKDGQNRISGTGEEPVNLIHQNDAIGVIISLINRPVANGIYNACSRVHPTRKEFYTRASEKLGFDLPPFISGEPRPWKRIVSDKIRSETGYQFQFDNPLDALEAIHPEP